MINNKNINNNNIIATQYFNSNNVTPFRSRNTSEQIFDNITNNNTNIITSSSSINNSAMSNNYNYSNSNHMNMNDTFSIDELIDDTLNPTTYFNTFK